MELRRVRGLKVCIFNLIQLVRLFATTAAAKYNGKLQTASSKNSLYSFEELAMKSCSDLVGTKKSKHNTDQVTHKTD